MITGEDAAAEVVRDLAVASTKPHELEPGGYYAVLTPNGVQKIDLTGDEYRVFPKRRTGTTIVSRVDSFAHYWAKHADEDSDIFADLKQARITAVLDAHSAETPNWQGHRLVLEMVKTDSWVAWTKLSGHLIGQQEFAEFVEEHAKDVASGGTVSSAELLEVGQKFHAHTKSEFQAGVRLANGETSFAYIEEISASARTDRGTIEIPSEFTLAIVPFDDCEPRTIKARFRYRLRNSELTMGFTLEDATGVEQAAIREVTAKVSEGCGGRTVMYGRPAA
jgi:uncharacterized protein YfdQ (DUF2303 family)